MPRRPTPAAARPEDHPLWYHGDVRTAAGERARGCPWGHHFALGQGELHMPSGYPNRASIDHAIALVQLNDGAWICRPETAAGHRGTPYISGPGDAMRYNVRLEFHVGSRRHLTRDAALRAAVSQVVRRARNAKRRVAHGGMHLSERITSHPQHADEIITWALSLLNKPAPAPVYVAPPPPAPLTVVRPGEQITLLKELAQ